ncbi:hypothetical protein [Nocardioides pelophilus]|uniref:hypothetical protein n=1 Tax=Nocardioides pelophilus TaxID=2172019 RepID=UPI001C805CFF|nr:hypothetical protein [Nocardioides pelophilus]
MTSEAADLRYPYPVEDPEVLEQQGRAISNLGVLLLDTHAEVNDDELKLARSWRSDTATKAASDVRHLATAMLGDSSSLADAAAAITTYVGHVEEARADIDGIRKKYDDANADRIHDNQHPPDWVDHRFEHEEWRESTQYAFEQKAKDLDDERTAVLATLRTRSQPAVAVLDATLARFVGNNPPTSQSLGEVAFEKASQNLELTGGRYDFQLRQAGLLTGPSPDGFYAEWLANAERQGVEPGVLVQIARDHGITPDSFDVLEGLEAITDPDGKTFFLLPEGVSGDDARDAALMTFILNAGTDYGEGTAHDFPIEPYTSDYVRYIKERQEANDWSYDDDVAFVDGNGGRLVTTPNGILMGAGGNWLQDVYSQKGGTTWGDIFMVNVDDSDPVAALKASIQAGRAVYDDGNGSVYTGNLDLDRLLHHEERHSHQWAEEGYAGFLSSYLWEQITGGNHTEEDAGLGDGGYK